MSKDDKSIIISPIEDIFGERFGRYSKYIIQERALPDARDGLKPVQRRILYGMSVEKNFYNKAYLKSAKTVGIVMGNYHPHGDSSIYEAMVRLSQPWKMNHLLVDMHGNNGSVDDDPAAAMRYTEARLTKLSQTLLEDLDKETVLFSPNFDDTTLEPTVLPARFPNLLVNGATGIAAGYATNMPPHNMDEIIDATVHRINNPACTLDDLMHFVKGPDFPSGGIVQGKDGIKAAFKNGKGRVVIRANTKIETHSNMHQIIVDELPFEVVKSNLVKKIDDIRLNKDLDAIIAIRDESDRNGLRIVIDVRKDADPEVTLNYLLKNTDLQVYYNYNMVAIVNKRPEQMGLSQLIDAYIAHREEVVYNRSKYIYNRLAARLHILDGLIKAVSVMDEIIKIIRASDNKASSKIGIIEAFEFSELQAEAIVMLQLYRLTSTDVTVLKEEYKQLLAQKQEVEAIMDSVVLLRQYVVNELRDIQKEFATPRRSEIQAEVEEIELDKADLITNEAVKVSVSSHGYVKRVSLRSFNMSESDMPGLKDNDELIGSLEVEILDTLLVFLDDGNYVFIPIYELEEHRWNDLGSHISSYAKGVSGAKIVSAIVVRDFDSYAFITTVSASGKIKRTEIRQFEAVRYSSTLEAMKLKDDKLVNAFVTYDNDDILIATKAGFMVKYPVSEINPTNLRTQGVIGINLGSKNDDTVIAATALRSDYIGLAVISDRGGVKRIKTDDLNEFKRTVKGEMLFNQTVSNPQYIRYIRPVTMDDRLVFAGDKALTLSTPEISIMDQSKSFSRPLELAENWYLIDKIERVQFKKKPLISKQSKLDI